MKMAQRTRAPNDMGKQYRARTNIVNTNAWSRMRGRVETIMPRSDEHVVGRFAQNPSRPGRVVYHPLREEITDGFSKSSDDLSVQGLKVQVTSIKGTV